MMSKNSPPQTDDPEHVNARTEGQGVSRTGIAQAAVCFAFVALWAILEERYLRLWRWLKRSGRILAFINFVRSQFNKKQNQPKQNQSLIAEALRADLKRNP